MKVRMYFWDCAAAARRFKMVVNVSSLLYTAESCTLVQIAFILSYCSFFSIVIVQELFWKGERILLNRSHGQGQAEGSVKQVRPTHWVAGCHVPTTFWSYRDMFLEKKTHYFLWPGLKLGWRCETCIRYYY